MAAKSARTDDKLLDMVEESGIKALGLLAAEVLDLKENTQDNYKLIMAEIKDVSDSVKLLVATQKDIQDNADAIKANTEAITDMKIKNVRLVAIVTAVGGVIGGGVGDWLKGLIAP